MAGDLTDCSFLSDFPCFFHFGNFTNLLGKEKENNFKKHLAGPALVCVCVCVSRLSHGHVPSVPSYVPSVPRTFCPLILNNFRINLPKRPGCPWDVPNFSLGRFRGIPTTVFLYVIFLYQFFLRICPFPFSRPLKKRPARNIPETVRNTIRSFSDKKIRNAPVRKPPIDSNRCDISCDF